VETGPPFLALRAAMRVELQWAFAWLAVTLVNFIVAGEESCPAHGGSPSCQPDGGAGNVVASESSASSPVPAPPMVTADLITQEVDELQGFINLCGDRITLLKELQESVSSKHNLSLPESHVRMLQEKLPLLSEAILDEDKAPVASADDYLVTKAVIPQEDPVAFIKFLPLRNPRTSSPAGSSNLAMPSALLVAVQSDGTVRLFSPTGELVHSFSAGHEQPVLHLAVSPSHDEYVVVTGDAGGVIRVHKVNVRQRRLTKEQKQQRRNSTDEKVSQYLGSQVNVTAQFSKQMQVPHGSNGEPAKMTALAMASQQGTKFFVAGDDEGKINVFTKNGTLRAKIDTTTTPGAGIEGLYAHLSSLLFRAGSEWGFIDLERLEVKHVECPKFAGRVTAAIIDSQQSHRVLVADETGTVWIFSVRNKRDCKIEHRFVKGATKGPIDLASIRGFILGLEQASNAEHPMSLVALNMSHVGKRKHELAQAPSPLVWRKGRPAAIGWAVHKRYQQGDLLAFLSEDGREIEIAELLMQVYTAPSEDSFGNFKLPVIAVAIVLVLGYQYVKQKGKFGGGPATGGGGGKKYDWDSDFASTLKNKRRLAGLKAARTH